MFVFKAAVVGAGTMGGEIAQVVAAACMVSGEVSSPSMTSIRRMTDAG